jgi:energy-coupling factor transport system ATP-binding protein
VELTIEPGERVAVLGASGSGKSTLLRAIAGVLPDDGGDSADDVEGIVTVGERDPRDARGAVGLVMQDPEAHTVMSRVGDDIAFGCENLGIERDAIRARVSHAANVVQLGLPMTASTSALSGGQRQRLALAGVLAMRPSVLVLDEPCANLDPAGVAAVRSAVAAVLDDTGATLVVVEHRIETWLDIVDRVVVLEAGGGIIADGSPSAVFEQFGAALRRSGVWVPGDRPARGSARRTGSAPDLQPVARTGGSPALRARDLCTTRDGRRPVGSGIDLSLPFGRVTALTGENGAGKSTLAMTLGGLLRPIGGEIDVIPESTPPFTWTSTTLAARIGTVFQEPAHQFVAASVRDELQVGADAVGLAADVARARIESVLDDFGLRALAESNPHTLSGGEQRRLAIATVLVTRPPVVIVDEPTSGQDRATWEAVVGALGSLADDGHSVIAVTHDKDLVRALDADEVIVERSDADPSSAGDRRESATGSWPSRVQPAASLLTALLVAVCLVTSLDIVSASVALALEVLLLPLLHVPTRRLLLGLAPVLAAAPIAGASIALYGTESGRTYFDLGFAHVTSGSLVLAAATILRLFAIAVPGVVLLIGTDPTDLGDGLAQVLRLPARFVLGALAALRMTSLMREDWRTLGLARRARGLADRRRIRRALTMSFAMLVIALRRGSSLAVAMESRGFGSSTRRTWARDARFGVREWLTMGIGLAVGLAGVGASLLAGTWHGV